MLGSLMLPMLNDRDGRVRLWRYGSELVPIQFADYVKREEGGVCS